MKGCLMGMGGFVAVVFGVVLVAGLWVMSTYNGIVSGDQAVEEFGVGFDEGLEHGPPAGVDHFDERHGVAVVAAGAFGFQHEHLAQGGGDFVFTEVMGGHGVAPEVFLGKVDSVAVVVFPDIAEDVR